MFLSDEKAFELLEKYGSPLYVYDESTLRKSCKDMHGLLPKKNFRVNYSAKANSNLELLKIVNSEDIDVDAMSPGEIFMQKKAGFSSDRIFYIGNNVSAEEMQYAINENIVVSVDSLSQLELFGTINPGGEVAIRFNPGVGAGHHEKVVTAGKKTKFGVQKDFVPQVKEILEKYDLKLVGIDQHIGSLFLDVIPYLEGVKSLLEIALEFPGLRFIDMGGGFGIPYKDEGSRLNLTELSDKLNDILDEFLEKYDNKDVRFKIEPGRYIAAECGVLLGKVYSVKDNYDTKYVGTDLGFNVLMRPILYDSFHDIHVAKEKDEKREKENSTIVGNICESGDIIANERTTEKIKEGDVIVVKNTGAYGYSMSSNYNCRLRPAEVLIDCDGNDKLIRRRDTFEDIIRNCVEI